MSRIKVCDQLPKENVSFKENAVYVEYGVTSLRFWSLQSADPIIYALFTGAYIAFEDIKWMNVLMEVTNSIALLLHPMSSITP